MTPNVTPETMADVVQRCEAQLVGWRVTRMREALAGAPLCVVAAGATHGAAQLWARLHEETGHPAWAATPYDFVARPLPARTRVLMLSTSGRHHDVLRAARHAVQRAPTVHAVVCQPGTPLADVLRDAGDQNGVLTLRAAEIGDEGLLPVHGVLPMLTLAARVRGVGGLLAPVFRAAEGAAVPLERPRDVVVLGAGLAAPAASDLAVKVRESGLCPAAAHDPRDFAHGAFMAYLPGHTVVVALGLLGQRAYLDRYLGDLPAPALRLQATRGGVEGALELFAQGALTLAALARAHGTWPARTDVPAWAGRLYHHAVDDR